MILIPKYTDIPIEMNFGAKLSGHVRMETFKGVEFPKGSGNVFEIAGTRKVRAEFHNMILNQGLNYIGQKLSAMVDYCHVGTGNAAEDAAQTGLSAFTAGVGLLSTTNTYWAQGAAPYYGNNQKLYRFAAGFALGDVNINEVGVGSTVTDGNLFSRALTTDGAGTPTTITVLLDEYLDVYYTLRNYPDHVNDDGTENDGTGTISISGTDYNYTIRVADVADAKYWGRNIFTGFNKHSASSDFVQATFYGSDAVLNGVTLRTSATENWSDWQNITVNPYTDFTYRNSLKYQAPLVNANFTNPAVGIKGMWAPSTIGAYQIVFDAPIPKDSTKIFEYVQEWAWSRKVIP